MDLLREDDDRRVAISQAAADRSDPGDLARMLAQERDTLQAIMDNSYAHVAYLDPQFNIVRVNSGYARGSGHTKEELIGRNHFELFPNPDNEAIFAQVRDSGQPVKYLARPFDFVDQPDRGTTYWDWTLTPVQDAMGRVQGLVLSLVDVTHQVRDGQERERLLAENRAQREFLERLVESAPVGIAVVRAADYRYELVNPSYQAIPGVPSDPMLGRTLAEVFPEVAARGALDLVTEAYCTGRTVSVRHHQALVGPGREDTYWNVDHVPLPGSDGAVDRVLILAHEVTDEVLAQRRIEALSAEAQRRADELAAVVAAMVDPVFVIDGEGRVVQSNPAAVTALGLDPVGLERSLLAQVLSLRTADGRRVPPEDLPSGRALRGETVPGEHWMLVGAAGDELMVLVTAAPVGRDCQPAGAVVTWHDVTDPTRAEMALRESEQKLSVLFDILPVGLSVLDQERNIRKQNAALATILDLPEDELSRGAYLRRRYLRADGTEMPPQDFPSVRAFHEQRQVRDVEIGIVKEDGERIWTSVSAVPLPFADWRAAVITVDITERKKAEEALKRERDFSDAVLDTSGGLVIVLDPEGRIVRFNRACEQASGYRCDEVKGISFWDLLLVQEEKASVQEVFARLRAGQFPNQNENYWVAKDGQRRWIAWSNTALVGGDGAVEYVIGTGIDITEHRHTEDRLRAALAETRRRQMEVSALLDGARLVLEQTHFQDTARSIFDTCKAITGATAGYVALSSRDGTQNELLFLDAGGHPCTVSPELPMPIRGLRGQVYRTGQVAYENSLASSPWVDYLPEGHVAVDNLLFAPLVIGGQVVGLLGLANKPGGFTADDARMAAAFGELVAIALHHSRLIESLEASERRYRSLVDTASAAIITADDRGRIAYWNRMAEQVFGYTAAQMVGAPLTQIMPERFHAAHEAGMQRAAATGTIRLAGETVETIGVRSDGTEFPLDASLATWRTSEGSFVTAVMHDITRRKAVEEALRVANESLAALVKASPLPILAFDLNRRIRRWNPAAARAFGWDEQEVLGRSNPLIPPDREQEYESLVARILEGQELSAIETVHQKKDGTRVDVNLWMSPLRDAEGQVHGVLVMIADITERKRAEAEMRRHHEEQAALYGITAAVATTLDQAELLSTVLGAVLPALAADVGWIALPGPAAGDRLDVVAARGTPEVLAAGETTVTVQDCAVYQGLAAGEGSQVEPRLVIDCPTLLADREIQSCACLPMSVGGDVLGVLKIGWRQPHLGSEFDPELLSTIGRQVGMALHNAQLYQAARQVDRLQILSDLDQALSSSLDLPTLAEVSLRRLATSVDAPQSWALLRMAGGEDHSEWWVRPLAGGWQVVDRSGQEAAHWQRLLDRAAREREPVALPTLALAPARHDQVEGWGAHGLLVPIWGENAVLALLALGGRATDRPFSDEDRTLAQVAARHAGQAMQNAHLYREVTRLLAEQERARVQLIQSEKMSALGRLAASIAHEINNPLQAMTSCMTLVHEEMDGRQRREKLDRYMGVIEQEVERISGIVRRMRDYYRPARERLEPTDLRVVFESVLELTGRQLQHCGISVEQAGWGDLPIIEANPDHLKQVFLNLVLNAVDAMPDGGTLRITAGLDQIQRAAEGPPQSAVWVDVSDTGVGMSAETQARLWEPFYTTKEHGAGLGLSISYGIVAAHSGQVSVTSQQGAGSTFRILLPVRQP